MFNLKSKIGAGIDLSDVGSEKPSFAFGAERDSANKTRVKQCRLRASAQKTKYLRALDPI